MSARPPIIACTIVTVLCISCGSNVSLSDEAREVDPPADRESIEPVLRKLAAIPARPELDARVAAKQAIIASGVSTEKLLLAILSGETGTMSDMVLVAPLALIAPSIEPERLLKVIGPHAGSEKHRESMQLILGYNFMAHDISSPEQVSELLRAYGSPVPRGLLRAIYFKFKPGDQAVLNAEVFGGGSFRSRGTMNVVNEVETLTGSFDKITLTGEERQEVLERLSILIETDQWWARRYAASAIARYRSLHTYELVGQLRDDPEQLVTEVLPPEQRRLP